MGQRTSHKPGTFSWTDLATNDASAAKSFYASLFGWEYEDSPIPEGGVYSMALRDGSEVAALSETQDQPPHWNCYVTVESADDATAHARDVGAGVMMDPFDVMDVGRMSVITDPAGAALCLWEPRTNIGASLVNAPGAMTWNDLLTPDPQASSEFYEAMFGWRTEEMEDAGGYRVIFNGDRTNGGMMPIDPEQMGPDVPPSWMPYFGHEDVRRLTEEIDGLGGQVFMGPMDILQGSIAVIGDPQGAVFAVWTGRYDD